MQSIKKSPEPQSLTKFNRTSHSNWSDIHTEANKHVYDDCILQCMVDQMNLCGYTELCLDNGVKHIDHYIKRDIDPKLTFNWGNMIAAIKDSRFGADYKDNVVSRVDYDPITKQYKHIYNPLVDDLSGKFCFETNGFMRPINSADVKAQTTIDVFNLNEDSLQACRCDIMEYVRDMRKGGMSDEDIRESLAGSGFVTALEYELSQKE